MALASEVSFTMTCSTYPTRRVPSMWRTASVVGMGRSTTASSWPREAARRVRSTGP